MFIHLSTASTSLNLQCFTRNPNITSISEHRFACARLWFFRSACSAIDYAYASWYIHYLACAFFFFYFRSDIIFSQHFFAIVSGAWVLRLSALPPGTTEQPARIKRDTSAPPPPLCCWCVTPKVLRRVRFAALAAAANCANNAIRYSPKFNFN